MDAICPKCSFHLNKYKGCDLYTINKCGHVYHAQCLISIKNIKKCKKCLINYDPRQCHKTYLYPEQKIPEKGNEENEYYEWFYCDRKTENVNDEFPNFALKLGINEKNYDIYAARVFLFDDIVPAYYIAAMKMAIATMGGKAYEITEDLDVLDISSDKETYYRWEECVNSGEIPKNAFNIAEISKNALILEETGETNEEENLYIICALYEGIMRYGKLIVSSEGNKAYIPYGQKEIQIENNYKVLVRDTSADM